MSLQRFTATRPRNMSLKYFSVLQSTKPCYKLLFCATKYYSDRNDVRTTSIQYYPVLQSSTPTVRPPKRRQNHLHPVLLRTTKYFYALQNDHQDYSNTTLYTTKNSPVLLRTAKYYSALQSTTPTETTSERRPSSTAPYSK